eukprot:9471121-Lingulodinium_polyedra.AAC.1
MPSARAQIWPNATEVSGATPGASAKETRPCCGAFAMAIREGMQRCRRQERATDSYHARAEPELRPRE